MLNSFTKIISWLWNNAEKIFVFVFFATFPFNLRKIFLTAHSFPKGEFNEYMTFSLNWSDILILCLIIIYIIKRLWRQYNQPTNVNTVSYNNNLFLSTVLRFYYTRNTLFFARFRNFRFLSETFLLFLFLFWMALSVFWARYWPIALYRLFIILLIFNFAVIIRNLVKKGHIKAEIIYLGLLLAGIFQSLIGIWQFILNRSLGLKMLEESILGPDLPGVAKIVVSGVKHIRAYGTFPHPNILAGFLILQIILLVSLFIQRLNERRKIENNVPHETILTRIPQWLFFFVLFINTTCFLLTFSRSAFISLALAGLALLFIKLVHARRIIWLITAIAIFTSLLHGSIYVSRHSDMFLFSTQSLEERNQYLDVSRETISTHPMLGVGLGQFVFQETISHPDWPGWQYQPVHNVYLLVTSELGIVGLTFILLFLLTFLSNYCILNLKSNLLTCHSFCIIIFSFLFISFFDHYFWDIKSGMIIFAIPIILLLVNNDNIKKHQKNPSK